MADTFRFRLASVLVFGLAVSAGYAGFTRVTTGDIVNDSGWCYGCAWADYSGDGAPDLFVTNNNPGQNRNDFLYLNDGRGQFTRMRTGPVSTSGGSSYGCTWGDCDNNGSPDLFVSNYNENNFLFLDSGGTFTRVTAGRIVNDGGRSTGCAWADYDNDGWLDLIVANRNEACFLYHNNGDATFSRVLTGPIATDVNNTSGCAWADYDNDGRLDLIVANVQTPNCLYHNEGGGTFTKVLTGPVVADTSYCNGASWGDVDNDGDQDLFVATGVLGMYPDLFYLNNGDGSFTKVTDGPIVRDTMWSGGSAWADVDNDGDLDLFVGAYDGRNRLFLNDGTGNFTRVDTGVVVEDGGYIMGVAFADCDNDGSLDLFTARNNYFGGNCGLYHNEGNSNSWLEVRCVGTISNRMGIGARVRVKARIGGRDVGQTREVTTQTGGGNSGQGDTRCHFGLGDASEVDSLIVRWPSGIVQVLTGVASDQILTVTEAQTAVGERAPRAAPVETAMPRIIRGMLLIPAESVVRPASCVLLDIAGRKVLDLRSGSNDISRLAPGVYFVALQGSANPERRTVKIVIQR